MEESGTKNFLPFRPLIIFFITVLALFSVVFYWLTVSAPAAFPAGKYIEIESGLSLDQSASFLKDEGLIRSTLMFRLFVSLFGTTKNVIAGEYRFASPENLYTVVKSVTDTEYQGRAFKVTIPEGYTNKDIAELIDGKLPNFNKANFLASAASLEGELFPDTYIFPITYTEKSVITRMHDNFNDKIKDIKPEIIGSKYTRKQIIIMASILEKEARTLPTRQIISGILWKRFDSGKMLQVDASFLYLLDKKSSDLTVDDLNIDSPYNTYKYKGLPPGAVSNPGLDAIVAALHPTATPYWFYLYGNDGNMHYAVTFDEHKRNKALYLK